MLRKLLQDFIDPARPCKQAPDFTRDLVKIKIRSRLQAQNHKTAVDLSSRQAFLLDDDTVDCEAQRTSPLRCPDIDRRCRDLPTTLQCGSEAAQPSIPRRHRKRPLE